MLESVQRDHAAIGDQAAGLRRLLAPRGLRVLPICGAASDQEQARIVAQLATLLASCGRRVIVLDQSPGAMAATWGLRARYELSHLLSEDRGWEQVLLEGPQGVVLLPAGRGLVQIDTGRARHDLLSQLYSLPMEPDMVLLNLSRTARCGVLADPRGDWLFIAPAGAGGLMPAYGQIKRLAASVRPQRLQVLVDGAQDAADGHVAFGNLAATARRFLDLDLYFCGNIHRDRAPFATQDACPEALRRLVADLDGWRLRSHVPSSAQDEKNPVHAHAVSPSWS